MLNLNRIEVIGNLTRDPELRFTTSNQAVCSLSIATNRRYRDQGGNWVDSPPEYHDVVVWGQVGERCSQLLKRGERIFISGRLQTRSWDAPDGQKKYKTEIVADTILGPDQVNKGVRSEGGDDSEQPARAASSTSGAPNAPRAAKAAKPTPAEDEISIDDIPF
jgi:single-strand DNA-binding protein